MFLAIGLGDKRRRAINDKWNRRGRMMNRVSMRCFMRGRVSSGGWAVTKLMSVDEKHDAQSPAGSEAGGARVSQPE